MDILFEFLLHVWFIHEKVLDNIFQYWRVFLQWIDLVNKNNIYRKTFHNVKDILVWYWEETSLMEKLYYFRKLENINCPIFVFNWIFFKLRKNKIKKNIKCKMKPKYLFIMNEGPLGDTRQFMSIPIKSTANNSPMIWKMIPALLIYNSHCRS